MSFLNTITSAVLPAASFARVRALVKKPRRDSPSSVRLSSSSTSSGNADARRTRTSEPCAAMSSFAEATVASMPGTFERNLHVAHVPSTSTISSTPRAARPSSTLSSMRARQGTSAYFAGSARRFDAMRAHANTAFPPVAATADATLEARSSSSGRNGMSASTGHTVVQAPHATHPSPSSSNTLLAANTEPVGQASAHFAHDAWRLRTTTQRSLARYTAFDSSASATSTMSTRFGMPIPRLVFRYFSRNVSSMARSSSGVFALMKQPPMGSASSTRSCGNSHTSTSAKNP